MNFDQPFKTNYHRQQMLSMQEENQQLRDRIAFLENRLTVSPQPTDIIQSLLMEIYQLNKEVITYRRFLSNHALYLINKRLAYKETP